jgi:hypothetical protein
MLYRVYTVGDDGHFIKVDEIDATDDDGAISQAQKLQNGLPLEIWNASRIVKRLDRRFR